MAGQVGLGRVCQAVLNVRVHLKWGPLKWEDGEEVASGWAGKGPL